MVKRCFFQTADCTDAMCRMVFCKNTLCGIVGAAMDLVDMDLERRESHKVAGTRRTDDFLVVVSSEQ